MKCTLFLLLVLPALVYGSHRCVLQHQTFTRISYPEGNTDGSSENCVLTINSRTSWCSNSGATCRSYQKYITNVPNNFVGDNTRIEQSDFATCVPVRYSSFTGTVQYHPTIGSSSCSLETGTTLYYSYKTPIECECVRNISQINF